MVLKLKLVVCVWREVGDVLKGGEKQRQALGVPPKAMKVRKAGQAPEKGMAAPAMLAKGEWGPPRGQGKEPRKSEGCPGLWERGR